MCYITSMPMARTWILADQMEMAQAEAGDLIVVFQSGAYGLTASSTAFLSHPAPKEVLV